ncbi:unnamed protein product, partial [Meganyctiphanes norvegica]
HLNTDNMRSLVLLCFLLGVAVAQQQAPGTLNVNKHLMELNQAHLPKDPNNLAATQQFLKEFARLKALADAAPDIQTHEQFPQAAAPTQQQQPVRQQVQRQPVQLQQQQHRFAAPVRTQARVQAPVQSPIQNPRAPTAAFDITSEIGKLLQSVQARNPSTPQAPSRPVALPAGAHASQQAGRHSGFRQPTGFRQQAPRTTITQSNIIPINNAQGLVINPRKFSGPLAHELPAAVNGPVQHTQFTPEVAAAHQALAAAHRNIIQQQIALQPQQGK